MSKQLRELHARQTILLVRQARSLNDRAAAENRDLLGEEVSAFEARRVRVDTASVAIDRETALVADKVRIDASTLSRPAREPADPLLLPRPRPLPLARGFVNVREPTCRKDTFIAAPSSIQRMPDPTSGCR